MMMMMMPCQLSPLAHSSLIQIIYTPKVMSTPGLATGKGDTLGGLPPLL